MTTGIGILLGLALTTGAESAMPPQTPYQTYYCSSFSSAEGQPSSNHYAFVKSRLESWKLHEEFKAAVKKKNPKNVGFYGACDLMKDAKKVQWMRGEVELAKVQLKKERWIEFKFKPSL